MILRDHSSVTLVQHQCSDEMVAAAAWVSTEGADSVVMTESATPGRMNGLIKYLVKHRHGSPFEHGSLTFLVETPIFVAREFMRHRAGWSYNEVSGRYRELDPVFWVPKDDRGVVNVSTPARPVMGVADPAKTAAVRADLEIAYTSAWDAYQRLLQQGIATEVARAALPVGIFTSFYATCNPRSLMHFLGLRVHSEQAAYQTYPQSEIEEVALAMEMVFENLMPRTYRAFVANGRVSP